LRNRGESKIGGINPRWIAPEILTGENYATSSDMYSLGLLMWETSHRQMAYDMNEELIQYHVVSERRRPEVCPQSNVFLKNNPPPPPSAPISREVSIAHFDGLCEGCWSVNPVVRPTARQVSERLRKIAVAEFPGLPWAFPSFSIGELVDPEDLEGPEGFKDSKDSKDHGVASWGVCSDCLFFFLIFSFFLFFLCYHFFLLFIILGFIGCIIYLIGFY
jgi:serine/threonine protein kinase